MDQSEWHHCYGVGWSGIITPESFAHPAKISVALAERIYTHALEAGWILPGDVVVDPFGGIGGTAHGAVRRRLKWIGCELEEKFVTMARENLRLFYDRMPVGWGAVKPVIVQGDSRNLVRVLRDGLVGRANVVVSPPPFCGEQRGGGIAANNGVNGNVRTGINCGYQNQAVTDGNLASMPSGMAPSLVVSSPPYAGIATGAGGLNTKPGADGQQSGRSALAPSQDTDQRYGSSEGQLAIASDQTFWEAAAAIVGQCFQLLRPGGVAIWVTKDFVRKGQRVPFGDQWQALCESRGFVTACRHRAMLVEDGGMQGGLFGGDDKALKVSRKSFFRRMAEAKGSPAINWEDVICVRKPGAD